jgi:hyperosmotically inducible protein
MRPLITFALVLAAASGSALGQSPGEPGGPPLPRADFVALDRNGDGYLSRFEANADKEIAKRFASFDLDNDGRLSEKEYVLAKEDNNNRILRDAAITARVKAALLAERGIPSLSISVDTYEGRVQLSGFVNTPEIVSKAGRVTATVNGVRTVHNNIAVK